MKISMKKLKKEIAKRLNVEFLDVSEHCTYIRLKANRYNYEYTTNYFKISIKGRGKKVKIDFNSNEFRKPLYFVTTFYDKNNRNIFDDIIDTLVLFNKFKGYSIDDIVLSHKKSKEFDLETFRNNIRKDILEKYSLEEIKVNLRSPKKSIISARADILYGNILDKIIKYIAEYREILHSMNVEIPDFPYIRVSNEDF